SADGGTSWAPAVLQEPVLPKALTRFRAAWQWTGSPAMLQSRATDETGMVQPTRAAFVPSADCAASITTTPSPAGRSTRKGRGSRRSLDGCTPATVPMLAVAPAIVVETPKRGQPISPGDLAPWDISVGPDGAGLPPGKGTAAQGEAVYAAKCQACHGE